MPMSSRAAARGASVGKTAGLVAALVVAVTSAGSCSEGVPSPVPVKRDAADFGDVARPAVPADAPAERSLLDGLRTPDGARSPDGGFFDGRAQPPDAPAVSGGCPGTATPDVLFVGDRTQPLSIRGTITAAAGGAVAVGQRVGIGLKRVQGGFFDGTFFESAYFFDPRVPRLPQFTYAFEGIPPGAYRVFAVVDSRVDGRFAEGDVGGFYDGSAAAPISNGEDGKVVNLASGPVCGVDFGVGALRCRASYGQTCARDSDCRGTICKCVGGGMITMEQNCVMEKPPSRALTCLDRRAECANQCGAYDVNVAAEAGCIGERF
jgi:hypothetical protein